MTIDPKAVLQHIPFLRDKSLTITPLSGGMTNLIFKVDVGNDAYVLRLFGAGTEHLGIDRDREVACSEAAFAGGVGVEVVSYLREQRALLTRYVPGQLLQSDDVQNPDILRRIAATLRLCHAAKVDERHGSFCVFRTVRAYVKLATDNKVPLPIELDDALRAFERLEAALRTSDPPGLCHNDLLAGNFIDDGKTMILIDWEYGAAGDRFFDLGNFATNLQLNEAQEQLLLQGYFGEVRDEHLCRLRLMRLASDMREASWGFVQQALSKLPAPEKYRSYLHYGESHLARFLKAISTAPL